MALLVCQVWVYGSSFTPQHKGSRGQKPGSCTVWTPISDRHSAGPPVWGWGLGSTWVGGHVGQPTLHVHSWAPREVQGEQGNLWEAVESDAFLSPWLTRLV